MWSGRLLQEERREVVRVDERWMQPGDLQRGIVVDSTLVDSVAVVMCVAVVVSVVVVVVVVVVLVIWEVGS